MYSSVLSAIAAASLACGVAQASTVNVDFEGGAFTAVGTGGTPSYRTYTEATWYENGVNTRFRSHVDFLNDYGY
jgi:hypothetical protein